jgi:2-methylisocitrate lyase-like PEP mutase family enzyme
MTTPGAALRARLVDDLVIAPGVWDALSARIVARAGFTAAYLGGNGLGLSLGKGQPYVTLTETASAVRAARDASGLGIIADAGAGFGEAQHVLGAVRELAAAGAAAIHIDDQPYPKRAGYHRGLGALAPVDEVCRKLVVARRAAEASGALVIARTDALRVVRSLPETLSRAKAYVEAGAEALMILDLTPEQAPVVQAALGRVPLVWIGGVSVPAPSVEQLRDAGFAAACYPFNGPAAVAAALTDLWGGLMADGLIHQDEDLLARMRRTTLEIVDMHERFAIEDGQ